MLRVFGGIGEIGDGVKVDNSHGVTVRVHLTVVPLVILYFRVVVVCL